MHRPLVISRKTTVRQLETFLRGEARVEYDRKHRVLYLVDREGLITYILPKTVLIHSPETGFGVVTHGEYVRTYISFIPKGETP